MELGLAMRPLVINVSGTPRSPSHGDRPLLLCTPEVAIG
jgi:hypothetical protein